MPKLKEDDINELIEFFRGKQSLYNPDQYSHVMFGKAAAAIEELKQQRRGIRLEGTVS